MRWMNYFGILLLLVALAGTPARSAAEEEKYQSLKEFSQIIDLIETSYVKDVDREELIEGAIQGMLKNLDPHSAYLDQDAFKEMQSETSGEFSGVGIEITLQNNQLTVVSPIEDTPAFEAGLQAGDIILEIDGESTQDISIMDAVSKIRGSKGSEVELTILSEGENSPETVTIKRDVIPVHSVKTQMLEKGYLYVRITNFNDRTTQELEEAVQDVQDLQGLVLDLRNNPGGVLDQAVSVADMFLEEGKIVYTKGKMEKAQMSFSAKDQELDLKT
ncbi:MAG: S41 family peptidase, partial [Desulfohalobiaceae bacterium]